MQFQRVIPVSYQIENILIDRIQNGQYSSDKKFPSEFELSEEFGVSRATVRTAIAALGARGLIIKKPGIGTFLSSENLLISGLESLESVISMAKRQGLDTHTKDVKVETIPADTFLSQVLRVEKDSAITSIKRTILIDGTTISFHEDFVPGNFLTPEQVNQLFTGSVLDIFDQIHTPPILYAEAEITTVISDDFLSKTLFVSKFSPLLLSKETLFDEGQTIVSYSKNYYIPDRFRIHVLRRKGIFHKTGGIV